MGAAAVAAPIVGGAFQAMADDKMAGEEIASYREQARYARLAAADAEKRGNAEAGRARMAGSQAIGEQRVAFASSGVDPSTGTAADLAASSRALSELDAKTIENNALREAWGLKLQAREYDSRAKAINSTRNLRAAGTLLGGVGQGAGYFGRR